MFVNHFAVLGNAGADPVWRITAKGGLVATVNVATHYRRRDVATGDWVESTEWHRITAFDELANELAHSVTKGTRVAAEGYMRTRKFVDANAQERYAHELVVTWLEYGPSAAARPAGRPVPEALPDTTEGPDADADVI